MFDEVALENGVVLLAREYVRSCKDICYLKVVSTKKMEKEEESELLLRLWEI